MHPETSPLDDLPSAPADAGNSQDIEDFIYLISHDVRSSVRALLELPQWIAEDLQEAGFPIEGSVATSIEMMNRHMGRLDRMLVDLLTFSRIGRMQNLCDNDLGQALDQVLDEGQIPSGFDVIRNIDVSTIRLGDRDLLTMLDALIQNAVKHHHKPAGRIVVHARQEGREIVIGVADDGPGVAPEFRERIFGAMTTLRPRDEVEGSGMGLANVRKISRLYGGAVTITDSPYGQGSLFETRLPVTGVGAGRQEMP